MNSVRAKLHVSEVVKKDYGAEVVKLTAQYSNTPEDNSFSKSTPSASMEMTIDNPAAHGFFEAGKQYFVDFIKATALVALLAMLAISCLAADYAPVPDGNADAQAKAKAAVDAVPEAAATQAPVAPPATTTLAAPADLGSVFSGPLADALSFLGQGSNWLLAPYGIFSTDHKYGIGLAAGYRLNDFLIPTMRLDYFDGRVWMPSASLQLQAPIRILDTVTVIPFAAPGLATPLSGRGTDNGSAVGIFVAGAAVRLGSHWDLVGDCEKWSGFKGLQFRGGIVWKPKGW